MSSRAITCLFPEKRSFPPSSGLTLKDYASEEKRELLNGLIEGASKTSVFKK